jgi:hypothetical protein
LTVPAVASNSTRESAARASRTTTQLTLYGTVSQSQYIDMQDDRARGEGNNPFGNYAGSSLPSPTDENPYGPLAGDEGEFELTLYSDEAHKSHAGTVVYICQYNFDKNGLCTAAFQLEQGTLIAKGPSNFTSTTFDLSILGGTYGYRSTRGTITIETLGTATQPQPVFRPAPMLQAERIVLAIHDA